MAHWKVAGSIPLVCMQNTPKCSYYNDNVDEPFFFYTFGTNFFGIRT